MLLLLTGLITHAQDLDIKPSQQAQGILESKNGMVDHATGLFHYKVPLYEIKSGNFTLPISLNYVANGVKYFSKSGIVGINWALNTGGVVTRTMRGGMPDEESEGYMRNPFFYGPTYSEIEAVNKRERDGESDLFTVSVNGQTIHFHLLLLGGTIHVETLDGTSVEIECVESMNNKIEGWIITDEAGTKYYFNQKEWSSSVYREIIVGSNSIENCNYISSWYLNKIEPLNEKPIIYHYLEEVRPVGNQKNINIENLYSNSEAHFQYGQPVTQLELAYSKYKPRFQAALGDAIRYIDIQNMYNSTLKKSEFFIENLGYLHDYSWYNSYIDSNITTNNKVMGILYNFSELSTVSSSMIQSLNELISKYSSNTMVALSLRNAKEVLKEYLTAEIDIYGKLTKNGAMHTVRSPLLSSIDYEDKKIKFLYTKRDDIVPGSGPSSYMPENIHCVKEVQLLDISRVKINSISFDNLTVTSAQNDYITLDKLTFKGSNGNPYNHIRFQYYTKSTNNTISDIWGYHKTYSTNRLDPNVDFACAKYKSLSKITQANGTSIELTYESNRIKPQSSEYNESVFGGIRIKNIKLKDTNQGTNDEINYSYPIDGDYVYYKCSSWERVEHPEFSDIHTYSWLINTNEAFINTGNNGLHYSFVIEEYVGKGKTAYHFFTRNIDNQYINDCNYWLYGLPLSTATYDTNNSLKSITKNVYYKSNGEEVYDNSSFYFIDAPTGLRNMYNNHFFQIRQCNYYINKELLVNICSAQGSQVIYIDGNERKYFSALNNYSKNIAPRADPAMPDQVYKISSGGKVVLAQQFNYIFENEAPKTPSLSDFYKTSGCNRKKEYLYENDFLLTHPSQIIETDINGNQEIKIIKRVRDISSQGNSTISNMIRCNNVLPIIKEQKLIKKNNSNNYQLISENVYDYSKYNLSGTDYICLNNVKTYTPLSPLNITTIEFSDPTLYTYGEENYQTINFSDYNFRAGAVIQTYNETVTDKKCINYDFDNSTIILKANCENHSAEAMDFMKFKHLDSYDYLSFTSSINILKTFYEKYCRITDFSSGEPNYIAFRNGPIHENIIKILEGMFTENKLSYEELKLLVDSWIRTTTVDEFQYLYQQNYSHFTPYNILTLYDVNLLNHLLTLTPFSISKYASINLADKESEINGYNQLTIDNVCNNTNYKLFLLYKSNYNKNCNYSVVHEGGTSTGQLSFNPSPDWKLHIEAIDLSSFSSIDSLILNKPNGFNAYIALVPENALFEATSYNADGTLFCKFNQNGQLERYEYDTVGRVTKVYDNNNNILKEFKYNVVLPQ